MNNSKVAVLLAAYNGQNWLSEQVTSILQQKGVDVTIYISVDKSSDGTEEFVDSVALANARVKALPHGERFGGAAKNFFRLVKEVDFSEFDFVAFSDQDDIWNADKLIRAINAIASYGVDAYSSNVTAFWSGGRREVIVKSQPQVEYDYLFEAAGPGCTYVFKQPLMGEIQRQVRERWSDIQAVTLHDWFCYAYARANGYNWFIDPVPSMLYRQHESNQVGINSGLPAFKKRFAKVTDGWWLSQALIIAQLVGMKDHVFVRSWSRRDRFNLAALALSSHKCRRRVRDKFIFSIFCLILAILPGRRA
ncbi:Glycosyl transferase family 2 [compost metagenome]